MKVKSIYLPGFLFLCLFALNFQWLNAQDFTPVVRQFTKQDYKASNQNWAVAQDSEGMVYFGNNQGLLQFDGGNWILYHMPENKLVRSVYIDHNDRIYVGSFEEFGYFEKNRYGELVYTSLSSGLKDYQMMNDEIWTIHQMGDKVIFQSFTSYFVLNGDRVTGVRQPFTFLFFSIYNNNIFTHTQQQGLSLVNLIDNQVVAFDEQKPGWQVICVLPFLNGKALVVTKSSGLFLLDKDRIEAFRTDEDDLLYKVEVNRAVVTKGGKIIIGTIQNGVIAFQRNGKKLWRLNRDNVLQNNTVLGMFVDPKDNLWLALDKGVAYVQMNSDVRYINSFVPGVGAVYDLSYAGPYLYIGTNQGLYVAEVNDAITEVRNIRPIGGVQGQVWNVSRFDGQIFCGNNQGMYEINGGNAELISPVQGGFSIKKGYIHGQEVLIQSTYTQLCVYLKKNGRWVFSHVVAGFVNPVRYLEIDYTGKIWASHLHQGLYEIQLTPDLKKIAKMTTYPSLDGKNNYNVNVFKVNNRVVFTDHHAFYTYDDIEKKIIPYEELNRKSGYFSSAYRIVPFSADLYWFIRENEAGLFRINNNEIALKDLLLFSSFGGQTVDDYQNVIPLSGKVCLFTLENGIVFYSLDHVRSKERNSELKVKSIFLADTETKALEYVDTGQRNKVLRVPYSKSNITFSLFYPDYTQLNSIYFEYKLDGMDQVWSLPVSSGIKNYNFLPSGDYVFRARVVSGSGSVLSEVEWQVEVLPPLYWTWPFRILYVLLFIGLLVGILVYLKHKMAHKHLMIRLADEERQRVEIEKREQQIIALEKEKLEAEVTLKSKELAESAMTIINKNEMLAVLRDEVLRQKEALGTHYPNKYADRLLKMIDENISSEDDWFRFQANFDRIHENFFRNLHRDYPDLTPNDLRFCAFLRLNLSSKDIAQLMNITLKGVEVARYRIRKKINLPSEKSLTDFMIEFT